MEDGRILALFQGRDEAAIQAVGEKYGSYCAAVAGKILDDPQDVEEVVSDTWLRAWDSIPPNRPVSLKLYLARIARNLAFDRFRSRCREKRGGGAVVLALEELRECAAPGQPGDSLDARELAGAVNTFLKKLPRREREVFLRRYFHLETAPEINRELGISEGNVRAILSRTRKKLRAYLIKEGLIDG